MVNRSSRKHQEAKFESASLSVLLLLLTLPRLIGLARPEAITKPQTGEGGCLPHTHSTCGCNPVNHHFQRECARELLAATGHRLPAPRSIHLFWRARTTTDRDGKVSDSRQNSWRQHRGAALYRSLQKYSEALHKR